MIRRKTNTMSKFKKGTVGYEIAKLVKRYGTYPMGIYIVREALLQSTQTDDVHFSKGMDSRLVMGDTPGYKKVQEEEEACIARLKAAGHIGGGK